MLCPRRLDVRKLMSVIPFFFPVELHLLPLHLSSNRKLLCRTVCLVSPFYIELRMRSFYIFRAEITILCTGRLRPVKTLLFLLCQELEHPQLSSHHLCGHFPSSQLPASAAHNKFALTKMALRGFPREAICTREQLWGRNLAVGGVRTQGGKAVHSSFACKLC